MITDQMPREAVLKAEYLRSDSIRTLILPPLESVRPYIKQMEEALSQENRKKVAIACNGIAGIVSSSFETCPPKVRILGVRPLEESEEDEDSVDELYGDYDFETALIRLWMRTAVLEKATSFGTLLSTLCHEICHHLDVVYFDLPNTFHTVGFYERAGLLYHHVRETPPRKLVWDKQRDGTDRINWPATMRGGNRPGQGI
jgi:hypothetical protein